MSTPSQPLSTADRLRKLGAISAREMWTRLRYTAYSRLERARHARGHLHHANRLRDALAPNLSRTRDWRSALLEARRNRTRRFFGGVEQLERTRAHFLTAFPAAHERARVEAARARRHEFAFFGGTYRYNGRVDWNADPVSRRQWPKLYHRDVPLHRGEERFGDVKHVWELGRHQFLIDLAKAWALDRSAPDAAEMRAVLFDWRAHNPVASGVAWSCALEPAFRVLSWLWAYFLTLDDGDFDDDSHVGWLEGLHDHGWFLYRHLEYYTSPYNHLIGEACALYCLGVLFPEFREAARWRAHARDVLESRLSQQFYSDGGSVEQSTFYHHATTGFYLLAALLGRENGEEFSAAVWAAIERAIEFSMLMQQPDGLTPRIGGADDGKPIRLEHLPLWDFRPYQAIGAVLFGRRDFKASAGRFFEDALWLLGHEGAQRFDALANEPPDPASRALVSSGYVVMRNRWADDADYVCFDCGDQAAGLRRDAIPSAAHGHADCLSIIVWRQGRPVLVDAGFHCYNGPKAWEDYFRETAAHNTIRIDGHDQARHINKMAWSHTYTATLEGHALGSASGWAVASHDGYRRLEQGPVVHRRAVWLRERGYIVIGDFLEGAGRHQLELTWQFAPGQLQLSEGCAIFEDSTAVRWFASTRLTARVFEGGSTPDGGWIAPSLGVKVAAPRLVLAGDIELPTTIVTVLTEADLRRAMVSRSAEPAPDALVIESERFADLLVVKGLNRRSALAEPSDALIAAWKREGHRPVPDGFVR